MSKLEIVQFPYGSDNYGVLIHSSETNETACIDAGDAKATEAALKQAGWRLTHIFITHHHADHTAGLKALKDSYNANVIGPREQSTAIHGLDQMVGDGDVFEFAGQRVEVLHTPGHTKDMINFFLPDAKLVFTGDTLFALGCGRLFEGSASMMWESLSKLMALPADTTVYCAHEYTLANARFAITVDPDNTELKDRIAAIEAQRKRNEATVPTSMALEMATNPFLRAGDASIRQHLNMLDASDDQVFAEIRKRKDAF